MSTHFPSKPLISQGWLRTLLFVLAYFLVLIGLAFGVSKGVARHFSLTDPGAIAARLSGDLLWLMALVSFFAAAITVFVFRRFVDRRSFASIGLESRQLNGESASGALLAVAIMGAGFVILYSSGHLVVNDIEFDGRSLFLQVGIMLLIAFAEEMVFRGYILNNLMDSFSKWIALGISALFFTCFHLENPHIQFVPLLNIFLAGVLLGINYLYTRNLWWPVGMHFAWNFMQGPVLGYPVSGIDMPSLLQIDIKGDPLVTGGAFGFEGSTVATGLVLLVIMMLYLFYEKKIGPQEISA